MSTPQPPALSREDYEAIEAAVMETSRGRWFLAEYARRNRHADTAVLLDAIARLERQLTRSESVAAPLELRRELTDMAESLSQTKLDLAHSLAEATGQAEPPRPERVYDAVVDASERADAVVLNAAEHVQEIAWALREGADEGRAVEDLDRQALEIYRASNQHALTTGRVRSIVSVLRQMEDRLQGIVGGWQSDFALVDAPEDRRGRHGRHGQPETILATAPSRIRDDIVFVDGPRLEERRQDVAPPPIRLAEIPATSADAVGPAAPRTISDNPFAALDGLPDQRRLAIFV
jgi:chemotaxis protein CheZ